MAHTVRLTRRIRFEAAHRLYSPDLSPERNLEIYGKCAREGGHGHNYEVDVTVEGAVDPVTGLLIRREEFDRILRRGIYDRCDHRDLERVILDRVTTGENLARVFRDWIEADLGAAGVRLHRVRVHETARNVFDVH